jgi:hypothetical protein
LNSCRTCSFLFRFCFRRGVPMSIFLVRLGSGSRRRPGLLQRQ